MNEGQTAEPRATPGARRERPQMIGHRGAAALAPENTLASLITALEIGVDSVEIDVHLSADDELVIIHDGTLDRTTNGTGAVRAHSLADLKRLDAGSWFYRPGATPAWDTELLRIPTLAEVMDLVRGRAVLCVELKHPEQYPGIEERLLDALRSSGLLGGNGATGVILLSFHEESVRRIARLAPDVPRFQLVPPGHATTDADLDEVRGYTHGIGPHHGSVTADLLAAAHERDLLVIPYTVNRPARMRELLGLGVDGLLSDNPVSLKLAARERFGEP